MYRGVLVEVMACMSGFQNHQLDMELFHWSLSYKFVVGQSQTLLDENKRRGFMNFT